jgi:hypothetical protein
MSGQAKTAELPDGKTCGDCQHMTRCSWLFQQPPGATACDWNPSRFRERQEAEPLP